MTEKNNEKKSDPKGLEHLKEASDGTLHKIQGELAENGLLDTEYGSHVNKEVWERLKNNPPINE